MAECTKDDDGGTSMKSGYATEVVVDLSRLRQLARQELIRRGLEA